VDELAAARRPRRVTPGALVVYVLATAVHAVTFGFLGVGLWLLLGGDNWPQRALGCLCLLVPAAVLPRPGRASHGTDVSETAPETIALVAEIAEVVGGPRPTSVWISDDLNAMVTTGAVRGRALVVGAPLWVACSPQARVAVIAHELGHLANRDLIRGRYVSAAAEGVLAWLDILTPWSPHEEHLLAAGEVGVGRGAIVRVLTWPVRAALMTYLRVLHRANTSAHRRQEHYADLAAVRAAGTAGAVDALETMLVMDGLLVTANRVAVTTGRPELRPALEAYMAGYGPERRQRARQEAAAEASRVDASHPPTFQRLRLVESVEHSHPVVALDAARCEAIERELGAALSSGLSSFADSFRGH
jgi:Zn-dependent protease with chaperone function